MSKDQRGDYRIEEIGGDAIDLVDYLKWPTFHMVGHSMGGMVLQWMAANYPGRAKSGVAITPAPACGFPKMDEAAMSMSRAVGDSAENLAGFYTRGTCARHNPAWARSTAQRFFSNTVHHAYERYSLAFIKTNFAQKVMGLSIPLKVLVGEHDPIITEQVMQQTVLKWFPKAELEVLANSGHYPMFEIPINLATVIQTFLAAHS